MAHLKVGGRSFGACSVAVMRGFNNSGGMGPKMLRVWVYEVGKAFGTMEMDNVGGYGDAGAELLIGNEANAFNPNMPDHHYYKEHSGHILRRAVRLLDAGEVYLSGWSSGKGGSGSQMRTVTWVIPNRAGMRKAHQRWEKLAKEHGSGKRSWDLYKTACDGYEAGQKEGAW